MSPSVLLGLVLWSSIIASVAPYTEIPLVGFFHTHDSEQELAFRVAIERINLHKTLLPNIRLIPKIEHVSFFDSFNTSKRICSLMMEGIGGIFGPHSIETSGVVKSICSIMNMPHLETHWDVSGMQSGYLVNLHPDPKLLAKALMDVIRDMDWRSFTIIYEKTDALVRLEEVLKAPEGLTVEGHVPFTVWQLPEDGDYRSLLKEIRLNSETRIVLDCSTEHIIPILKQAREVNMLDDYHTYLLTSLDAHTLDYGALLTRGTNITVLRLTDPNRLSVQGAVHDWVFEESRHGRYLPVTPETVMTESALMYDAVNLYARALHGLQQSVEVSLLNCDSLDTTWEYGYTIIEYMKIMELEGMTGKIRFDSEGHRSFFTVEINELGRNGLRKIGSWDPESGIYYTRTKSEMDSEIHQSLSNKTFIVVSRIGEPFLRYKEGVGLKDNDMYEGYSMDVIDEIAKDLGFKYKFVMSPDGQYGSFNRKTKQWNGLIKELKERRADLAICDLTITYDRRSAVDFTMPFMTLGISILFSKPAKQPPNLFSFLSPLSLDVWVFMATAYLGVSLVLYILCRIAPNEWENPHPCNSEPEELECTFSLHNCLWFSIGSLMAQGCDLLPKAGSTRTLAGMWWFFVLIMISSYTANLAAFLTMERMDDTIENVEDLAKKSKIKYGVLKGGSTAGFFRNSNNSLYQKMWSVMESTRPSVFVKSNDEGVERVLKGKRGYAFFMESTSIEYQIEQHCELTQVGGLLDSKGYGIAMPFNSPYRTAVSGSVLKMQESGKLLELKNKWWKEKSGISCGDTATEVVSTNELGISNVGGVFLVLIAGCGVAFLVAILEFLWNIRKVAVQEKISPKKAFLLELKFALACSESVKPVRWIRREGSAQNSALQLNAFDQLNINKNDNDSYD